MLCHTITLTETNQIISPRFLYTRWIINSMSVWRLHTHQSKVWISVPDIWANYIKWGIMACDDVTKILVHSQVQALLSALGCPAVITKNSVYRTHNVCPWKKSTVNINSFIPGFPDIYSTSHTTIDIILISTKHTGKGPGNPGFPSGPWGEMEWFKGIIIPYNIWTQVS